MPIWAAWCTAKTRISSGTFPQKGFRYDECQIDKSGRWLVIKEKIGTDPSSEVDDRVIDLQSGVERDLLDRNGAGGHSDTGFGYLVASDNHNSLPGAVRLWDFNLDLQGGEPVASVEGQGTLVFQTTTWDTDVGHVAFGNAQAGVPIGQQYVCSANASRKAAVARERNPLLPAGWIARRPGRRAQSHQPRCLRRRERRLREASEGQPRHHRRVLHLDGQRGDEPPRCVHRANSEGPTRRPRRPAFTELGARSRSMPPAPTSPAAGR